MYLQAGAPGRLTVTYQNEEENLIFGDNVGKVSRAFVDDSRGKILDAEVARIIPPESQLRMTNHHFRLEGFPGRSCPLNFFVDGRIAGSVRAFIERLF